MKRTFQILIALILAYGWLWSRWLQDHGFITEAATSWVLIVLGVLFLVQQIWITAAPKPRARVAIDEQREIAQTCLDTILLKYCMLLQDDLQINPKPLRVNLMLATRRAPLKWHMKIYYTACSEGESFGPDEMDAIWKRGEGAVGYAWQSREVVVFDSEDERFRGPLDSVPDAHKKFADRVKSLLAVPIVRGKSVAGILTLEAFGILSIPGSTRTR